MRAKQLHAARGIDLIECVEHDTRHAPFVEFVGPENIEKLQSGPEIGGLTLCNFAQGPAVEIIF